MELIGRGRDADVFALDASRVLRRYRDGGPAREEARLMAYLAEQGCPVPRVHDVSGADMVMDRLTGPTMAQDLGRHPWRAYAHGRTLGRLQAALHRVPPPGRLPRRFPTGRAGEDRVLHLDLHPENVVLTPGGPVVIDWRSAAAGDPAADAALTVAVLRGVVLGGMQRAGVRVLLRGFLRDCAVDPAPRLAEAVAARLGDPNLRPEEAERLRRLSRRTPGGN
ncbi:MULTISPECIES: phosphotransferase [unclassified Streptomyces]|uniref:phosphotransferase n=1 Tax=unclassified Streptomyces TaxID=2593676 RepID=UPI00381ADA26